LIVLTDTNKQFVRGYEFRAKARAAMEARNAKAALATAREESKAEKLRDRESSLADEARGARRGAANAVGLGGLSYTALLPTVAAFAFVAAMGKAITVGGEFAYQMQAVRGVAQESAGAIDAASKSVLALGANSVLGPLDLAKSMRVLVQAGYNTKDALTALPSVMALATVGQLDMATATTIASSAMHQFDLSASDIGHVADVISKGAALSATSVEQIGTALGYTNNLATEFNFGMEETIGMLSAMSARGIAGSKAGTSLNQMFAHLTSAAPKVTSALKQLNLELYTKEGDFRGPLPILRELKATLSSYNQQGQISFLQSLFGVRDMKAAVVLLDEINGKVAEFEQTLKKSSTGLGFAVEAQIIQMDTAEGAMKKAANTIEATFITAGGGASEALKGMALAVRDIFADPAIALGISNTITALTGMLRVLTDYPKTVMSIAAAYTAWKIGSWVKDIGFMREALLELKVVQRASAAAALGFATAEVAAAEATTTAAAAAETAAVGMNLTLGGWLLIGAAVATAAYALYQFFTTQKDINALPDRTEKYKDLEAAAEARLAAADKRLKQAQGTLSSDSTLATSQDDYNAIKSWREVKEATTKQFEALRKPEYMSRGLGGYATLADAQNASNSREEYETYLAEEKVAKKKLDKISSLVKLAEAKEAEAKKQEAAKAGKSKYGTQGREKPATPGELSQALRAETGDANRAIADEDFQAAHARKMLAFSQEGKVAAVYAKEQEDLEANLAARKLAIIYEYAGKVMALSKDTKGRTEELDKLEALEKKTLMDEGFRVEESKASKQAELYKWLHATDLAQDKSIRDTKADAAKKEGVGELAFIVSASAEKIKLKEEELANLSEIQLRYDAAKASTDQVAMDLADKAKLKESEKFGQAVIAVEESVAKKIKELIHSQEVAYKEAAYQRSVTIKALSQTGVVSGYRSAKDVAAANRAELAHAYITASDERDRQAELNYDAASTPEAKLAILDKQQQDERALTKDHQGKLFLSEKMAQRGLTKERYDAYQQYTTLASNALGAIADMIGTDSKEAFEKQKKYRVAAATLDAVGGAAKAFAETPGGIYAMIAAGVVAAAIGVVRVQQIRQTQYQGQAHDGMPFIPSTGTYMLEKGERVVKKEDNTKLQQFLEKPQQQRAPQVTQVTLQINAVDAPGVARLLSQNEGLIQGLVQRGYDQRLKSGGPLR
jgi:TP901 family phage tail tape measure protein